MDEQEFINRFGMTREEYGKKFGTLQDPNMGKGATLRQKAVDKVAGVLQSIGYGDQYSSYDFARGLLGDADSSSIAESIGVLDFTPAQIPFAIQEAKRAYDRGDYLESGLGAGFAAIETFPAMKLITKPVKNFLKNISTKLSTGAPVDPGRRAVLSGIAATPVVAGALSEIPVGKIMEDIVPVSDIPAVKPVAKKIAGAIVKNVGQPSKNSVINQLMDSTGFGDSFNYGGSDMKKEMGSFLSELNKAKKYFDMKKKAVDQDELGMISTNSGMADYLENLQIQFGYTDDQILDLINETSSITKKNEGVWEDYFRGMSEGDPEFGKKYNLGTEEGDWEDWSEDDFFEKLYGSYETDIVGNTIAKVED